MKTKSEFNKFNNLTMRSTNISLLNRCLYDVTLKNSLSLIKNRPLIAKRFAPNVTSLTGTVNFSSSTLHSLVHIQIKKYSTNFSTLNNSLNNKKIDNKLTSKPKIPKI